MFRTWPEEVVKKVAEESRLRDYNSDEVIVRDSCKLHWIIFITKVKSWDCEEGGVIKQFSFMTSDAGGVGGVNSENWVLKIVELPRIGKKVLM